MPTLLELYTEHATALARAAAAREMGEPTRVLGAAAETAEARLLAALREADARADALVRLVATWREWAVSEAHDLADDSITLESSEWVPGPAADLLKHMACAEALVAALALCPPEPATGRSTRERRVAMFEGTCRCGAKFNSPDELADHVDRCRLPAAVKFAPDAVRAAALVRLCRALDNAVDYEGVDWRKALTQSPYIGEDDELAAAWAEVGRLCPPEPATGGGE